MIDKRNICVFDTVKMNNEIKAVIAKFTPDLNKEK